MPITNGNGNSSSFNGGTITEALDIDVAAPALPITGVNVGTQTFTVAGNHVSLLGVGTAFYVLGSTGNDLEYDIASSTFVTDHTDLVVVQVIADPTADGNIRPDIGPLLTVYQPDNPTGAFGLDITNADTGANIQTLLDGLGASNQALLLITAGGAGSARVALVDDLKDGELSFSTAGGIYLQPRSDSADGATFIEVVDKLGNDALVVEADGKLGFFGHAPAAQQTGVAVDVAAIHAALVALGLITA